MKYVLGESAARFLREQMVKDRSYKPAQPLPSREVRRDFAGVASAPAAKFHFKYTHEESSSGGQTTHTVTIGEGAVQIGGFTIFASQGTVASGLTSGTCYICAQVVLSTGAVSFVGYASTSAIQSAQLDMTKYIFPLYKLNDYAVVLDYRPMPNAGVWEDETLVSSSS